MRRLGETDLEVFPLCLGGNVFGWTADRDESFAVLDAYAAAGGNFVDTADVYRDGRSEEIIGEWMRARGNRQDIIVATKVGFEGGLGAANVRRHAEESLRRLQTDCIDLYYAHRDDPQTPLAETLGAFGELAAEGKVRYVAASNYSAPRLAEALELAAAEGLPRFVALQPHYNLLERDEYEPELRDLCARERLACLPYYGLAKGFLTGKYRPGRKVDSPRAERAEAYLNERGLRALDALEDVAAAHGATPAATALAWLAAQPTVVAPIASARSVAQLEDLLPMATLQLSDEELARLADAAA